MRMDMERFEVIEMEKESKERIKRYIIGSLFELISGKQTREYIAEEIMKQTQDVKKLGDIQKIVLGYLADEIDKEKEKQAIAISVKIASFVKNENVGDEYENE